MFKARGKSQKNIKEEEIVFSASFRRSAAVESTQVCHAVENTHNMPVMWLHPKEFNIAFLV